MPDPPPPSAAPKPPQFIDATGKPITVENEQDATKAFLEGKLGVVGQRVDIRDKQGNLGTVDAGDLDQAVRAGFTVVPPQDAERERLQKEYGGLGSQATAAGEGALRGATLGLSDAAIVGLGGEAAREHLAKTQAANPIAAGGGELVGALAPILLSDGAAAPEVAEGGLLRSGARAVASPALAVDAAGGVAERIAAAAVGEGSENLAARIAQRALTTGARGAVEGALYGVGSQISEDVLGDHELTAEQLLAAAGHGALFGGLTGGALGAGGEALSTAGGALRRRLSPIARNLADTQAWKSLIPAGSMKALTREAEGVRGGAKAIGRMLLDDGLVKFGDDIDAIAPRIAEAKGAAETKLGALLDEAQAAGAKVEGERLAGRIQKEVLGDLSRSPNLNRSAISKVEDLVEDLKPIAESGNLRELRNWRAKLDDHINWGPGADKPANEALQKARRIIEDELTDFGDSATRKMGGDWADRYKAAKLDLQRLIVADKAAQQSVQAATLSNRSISLSDYISGAAGLATNGPTGLALAAGNKVLRERGSATVATVMDRLADIGAMRKVADRVDRDVANAAKAFVSGERKALPEGTSRIPLDRYEEEVAKARAAAAANPETQQQAIQAHLQSITTNAPKIAAAFNMASVRAATYLASKVPKSDNGNLDTLQPNLHPPRVNDADKASFLRTVQAVNDPRSVVRDMQHGRVSKEGVDALKAVYPKLYGDVQTKVLEQVAGSRKPLTYQQRQQVALLTGVPTDPALKPANIRLFQSSFDGAKPGGQPGGPPHRQLSSFGGKDVRLKGQ